MQQLQSWARQPIVARYTGLFIKAKRDHAFRVRVCVGWAGPVQGKTLGLGNLPVGKTERPLKIFLAVSGS